MAIAGTRTLKGKRDRAILAVLLGYGLRLRELADLDFTHLQKREGHWAIIDLIGKGGHIRTVPVPDWVKAAIDEWAAAAAISAARCFVASAGQVSIGAGASQGRAGEIATGVLAPDFEAAFGTTIPRGAGVEFSMWGPS